MAGTRWAGLLAPVNTPTDDGRRFLTFSHRNLPLGLKWQRQDEPAHGTSVIVGSLEAVNVGTMKEAVAAGWISKDAAANTKLDPAAVGVWGGGELFDDVDPREMPRLAEDVAEAKLLTERGVVTCSVDPIPVGPVFMVEPGQDEPPTEGRWNEMFDEFMATGIEPPLEVLFSEGLIGAATLVVLPAFSEVRPFELRPVAEDTTPVPTPAALVASLTAAAAPVVAIPADVFVLPTACDPDAGVAGGVYPITVEAQRPGEEFLRVHGFVAAAGVCHVEFKDVCVTAPTSALDYAPFHRYPIDVIGGGELGMVATGRLTSGFGKSGTGCHCCRGKDDHACNSFGLADTIAHYDKMQVLANVCAGHDEAGNIAVAGFAPLDLDPAARAVLSRQKFSGDWREYGGNLELVEILALAREREAFPIPALSLRDGRQLSLTAAGAVRPNHTRRPAVDQDALAKRIADRVVAGLRATPADVLVEAPTEPEPEPEPEPAPDDAEPADETPDLAEEAAALAAEIGAVVDGATPEARQRAAEATDLLKELELANV
jgi:hypothetical protein